MKRHRRTLTTIQLEYVDTVLHARAKWAHRKDGGHSHRTIRAARDRFLTEMRQWGFNDSFIACALQDAKDIIALEMNSDFSE